MMDRRPALATTRMHWDDLRVFLAVARQRTLSAASHLLGMTQPTVGRRLDAFERRLGTKLFWRSRNGLTLTPAGRALLGHAERIEQEVLAAERAVAGQDDELRGQVRVTASEWLTVRVVAPLLVPFLARSPSLTVELVADARWLDLPRREADVALRPARFRHDSVYQRAIARIGFGLYASDGYLAERGAPDFTIGCEGHDIVTMLAEPPGIADIEWLHAIAPRARVAARCNGREAQATMASAGVGMVCLPRFVGDASPGLRLLKPPSTPPLRQLWLGAHRDARSVPRVKAICAHLVSTLATLQPALSPER